MISVEELEKLRPEKYPRNDIGTSNLFSTVYSSALVYVPERKSFFVYDGKVWKKDIGDLETHEFAKEFVLSIMEYFRQKEEDNEEVLKHYSKYLSRDKRKKLIDDTKSIKPISIDQFDKQPYFVNCLNCTVNIATGEYHSHDPADYLTSLSNVWYDPNAKSEDFENFIDSIMEGNRDLIEYLKRALGYSISSATFQECFFITYGRTTRNGKGTLNSTIMHMLGDYAKTASYEVFESKKYKSNSNASEDIARLAGARYVSVSEPEEGMTLNSSLIKTLSGNDRITARYLYENSFEFVASFKLWINTNHLPAIPDDTVFKSGRVQLIPFNKHFNQSEQDKGLKARLIKKENISGIFNWCMKGFQLMAEEGGLKIPEIIKKEIEKYQENNDRIGEFLQECFTADLEGKHREKLSKVYRVYAHWCKENGYKVLNKKNFKNKMCERISVDSYRGQDHLVGYYINQEIPAEWCA